MKTMMKWFVGFACAVAFIAIAFTPSSAAAQYACRPMSRVGPQSIEGPMTLTCSACTNAIVIPAGKKICLNGDTCTSAIFDTAGTPRADSLSVGTLSVGNVVASGSLYNSTASFGGSLGFSDPTRWLSTTTALLESSTTATAGIDVAFTLNTLVDLADSDKIMSVQRAGVEKAYLLANGNLQVNTLESTSSVASGTGLFISRSASPGMRFRGYSNADGFIPAAAVGNYNTLAGGKILSLYSDKFATERAYFDYLGSLTISGTASSTNAITVPAGARIAFGTSSYLYNSVGGTVSSSGGMFANGVIESNSGVKVGPSSATCEAATRGIQRYVEGAAGVADKVEVCMKSAADTYAWAVMFTAP